jgi:hypothetical protein
LPFLELLAASKKVGDKRNEILQPIGDSREHDDPESELRKMLLMR